VLFVLGLGAKYVSGANWGHDWHTFAPYGFGGIGAGAAYIFFAYIGFDAVSTTAQEAKNPQRDLPIGIIASLAICTLLYIGVAAVLTGMVPWQSVNIEAPIARAFADRNLGWASDIITLGALAGLTSVMLVMLLGQTRVLYAMATDGLLPKKFFAEVHPRFRTPFKNTFLDAGGHRWCAHAYRRHRQNGEHWNTASVCDCVYRDHDFAEDGSGEVAAFPYAVGAAGAADGYPVQRLHDGQAGLAELGPAPHLAGGGHDRLLHLQRESQPGADARTGLA
jgi:hypothetical protein